jgi:hypothetical protein
MARVHRRRGLVIAVLAVVAAGGVMLLRSRSETLVADLVEQLNVARKQPASAVFDVTDVTIDGQTKRSIVAHEQTRLTYHVTLPKHAEFHVGMALAPQAWTQPGDGVLFLIGVSDGHSYQTLHSIVIDPHGAPADRRWHEASFSLEEYAGLTVDIILNTRAGLAPTANTLNDLAVWGAPKVVVR